MPRDADLRTTLVCARLGLEVDLLLPAGKPIRGDTGQAIVREAAAPGKCLCMASTKFCVHRAVGQKLRVLRAALPSFTIGLQELVDRSRRNVCARESSDPCVACFAIRASEAEISEQGVRPAPEEPLCKAFEPGACETAAHISDGAYAVGRIIPIRWGEGDGCRQPQGAPKRFAS